MPTIEELQGVVAGLISVVKDLTTNVSQVTQTVGNMAEAAPAAPHHDHNQGLRMPSMQLPSFCRDSVVQDAPNHIYGTFDLFLCNHNINFDVTWIALCLPIKVLLF
jgi:hypothetical protein